LSLTPFLNKIESTAHSITFTWLTAANSASFLPASSYRNFQMSGALSFRKRIKDAGGKKMLACFTKPATPGSAVKYLGRANGACKNSPDYPFR